MQCINPSCLARAGAAPCTVITRTGSESMKATSDFDPIAPDEEVNLSMDFTEVLSQGDSIESISAWNCTVSDRSVAEDASPGSRLIGSPSLAGNLVTQTVDQAIPNVTYVMEAVVLTVGGETLSLWAYCLCDPVGLG